jgi:hypothetical protein
METVITTAKFEIKFLFPLWIESLALRLVEGDGGGADEIR